MKTMKEKIEILTEEAAAARWNYYELHRAGRNVEADEAYDKWWALVAKIDALEATEAETAAESDAAGVTAPVTSVEVHIAEAQAAAARDCYCTTCARKCCPARDKVQRKTLGECEKYGGGYQPSVDPWDVAEVVRRYGVHVA